MKARRLDINISDSTMKRLIYALSVKYLLARAIHVATELNVGKFITDTPKSFDELKVNFHDTHYEYFIRLLKFLAHHGACAVTEQEEFYATEMTEYLINSGEGMNLIVSNEEWCSQGDLLKYLAKNQSEVDSLLSKNIDVKINGNTVTVTADPADMIYLYSRFHLISRSLHIAAQLGITEYINSDKELDVDSFIKEKDLGEQEVSCLMKLLSLFELVAPVKKSWIISDILWRTLGDSEETISPAFCMIDDAWWNSVSELKYAIITGEISFEKANRISFFKYLEGNKNFQKKFDEGLGCFSKEDDMDIVDAMDFSDYKSIADIGGGYGGLLHHLFQKYSSSIRELIHFEQPHVLKNAHPALTNGKASEKYSAVAGDLFKPENENNLPINKDLYIIKGVLHDFDDEKVISALSNIRAAMSDHSELLVIERSLRSDNSLNINYSSDILMLVLLDGRERSMADWLMLFRYSGLTCTNSQKAPIAGDFSLLCCRKYQPSVILSLNHPVPEESNVETEKNNIDRASNKN